MSASLAAVSTFLFSLAISYQRWESLMLYATDLTSNLTVNSSEKKYLFIYLVDVLCNDTVSGSYWLCIGASGAFISE